MPRIYIIFLLSAILLAVAAAPAKAFWLEPPKPEPFTIHGARETAPPSDKKGLFTVQDNFNLFTREDGNTPILLPHSDYFVAADTINANLPIFGIFSHPVKPTGDPIANLIYADLKLKKLTEQYAKLQEKAKKLLKDNQYSAISTGTIKTTELTTINQELQQLTTKLSTVNTKKTASAAANTKATTNSADSSNLLITLHQLKKQQEQQQQAARIPTRNIPTGNQPGTKTGISGRRNSNHPESPTASSLDNHEHPFAGSEEITIPYIIKLPLRIFRYILTHKFESLFIGFFILMFTSIIFGSRS